MIKTLTCIFIIPYRTTHRTLFTTKWQQTKTCRNKENNNKTVTNVTATKTTTRKSVNKLI